MVLGFTIPSGPTRAAHPYLDGFEPHHRGQHQRFSFSYVAFTEDGSSHSSQFFDCGDAAIMGNDFAPQDQLGMSTST
jgi:hypothetical protein